MDKTALLHETSRLANKNDRWLYVNILGEGSFGTVFLAKDTEQNGKFVAIKVIKAKASLWQVVSGGKPSQVKGGKQEAQILFRLVHKHVLRIFDKFEFKKHPFTRGLAIVTEYCSKGNLHECLKRYGCPPFRHRVSWYKELALGLEFIHFNGIVHRDIKPENVLIDSNNVLKIADVGLAKAIWDVQEGSLEQKTLIQEHSMSTVSGTPAYIAPEVYIGSYSTQCDIFSLGLVFCMMVECPDPLVPLVQYPVESSLSLGQVLADDQDARSLPGMQILNISRGTPSEEVLFNRMLKYHAHHRLTASQLVAEIDNLEEPVPPDFSEKPPKTPRRTWLGIVGYYCILCACCLPCVAVSLLVLGKIYPHLARILPKRSLPEL